MRTYIERLIHSDLVVTTPSRGLKNKVKPYDNFRVILPIVPESLRPYAIQYILKCSFQLNMLIVGIKETLWRIEVAIVFNVF